MYKCIICTKEHNNLWNHNLPNMYCIECEIIRKDAKAVVTQVMDTLYLGDMKAASTFDGERLCVHENPDYASMHHIPYLIEFPRSPLDRSGGLASFEQLDKIVNFINEKMKSGTRLIVHCKGGVERSPLAIAYFLIKSGYYPNFDEAYKFLKSIRPVVSDRTFWLPKS